MLEEEQQMYDLLNVMLESGQELTKEELEDYYDFLEQDLREEIEDQKTTYRNIRYKMVLCGIIDRFRGRRKDDVKVVDGMIKQKNMKSIENYTKLYDHVIESNGELTNNQARLIRTQLLFCEEYSQKVQQDSFSYINRIFNKNRALITYLIDSMNIDDQLLELERSNSQRICKLKK